MTRTIFLLFFSIWGSALSAAQYSALVMDARTGEVLHAKNADTRLHPASLTKMMTLYLVFEAVETGRVKLDQKVRISKNAAAEPSSKLGLRYGQEISVRHLIRATAIKSANDAATALAEAIGGTEANFARLMTERARAMGMSRTTFKNAHGLTEKGHLSTARDMTLLGRRVFYDFPEYYNLFSRLETNAGVRSVRNTNTRLLQNYRGADGIKTGFTNAAGFNLVASAERGKKRVIATVFGGQSVASRNRRVAELLDMGFARAPTQVVVLKPEKLAPIDGPKNTGLVLRAPRAKMRSGFPRARPQSVLIIAKRTEKVRIQREQEIILAATAALSARAKIPNLAEKNREEDGVTGLVPRPRALASTQHAKNLQRVEISPKAAENGWAVDVGRFRSRQEAEKILLRLTLADMGSLNDAGRQVDNVLQKGVRVYRARFNDLSQSDALRACARLRARSAPCEAIQPSYQN